MGLETLPNATLGYCTNVHPGTTLNEVKSQLETHAIQAKQSVSPAAPFGLGLWFSNELSRELSNPLAIETFRHWLDERGLFCFTINGFPFGDFHQPVVKHRVYEPDWASPERFAYTKCLATILAGLLPDGLNEGSISTLPLGWGQAMDATKTTAAAAQLTDLVHELARIELITGKRIRVALEPEPGCALESAPDVVQFFERHLLGTADEVSVRGYLGVCHDVCHSAVMFEPQQQALDTYAAAGLDVVKAQLSNAVETRLDSNNDNQITSRLQALRRFQDQRFLHQTTLQTADGQTSFYDDLPDAIRQLESDRGPAIARTHFHVPLFHETLGPLHTTQPDLQTMLRSPAIQNIHHLEVETYAWSVLPEPHATDRLAEGIAHELRWVAQQLRQHHRPNPA